MKVATLHKLGKWSIVIAFLISTAWPQVYARSFGNSLSFSSHSDLIAQITGRVTGENGEPLIGATILVKGTTIGTVTDFDGNYTIDAPEGSTLIFSYTGYATREIEVGNQTQINVILQPDVAQLSEIVVTGYGSQRRENLTGAVGVVTAEELDARPITNTSQALQGQVSGVWINQTSGEPGQDDANILIRGIGTLNNSNPLVLVDGIEAPINNIDPNDISSITVLKDAASAAIYGSRAANGVILITTKRGKQGEKPTFSYNSYVGTQEPTNIPDYIWDSETFMQLRNEADINSGRDPLYPDDLIREYAQIGPNTNWFDVVFRNGFIQQHNLSVSGGSEETNFLISVGYLDQEGVIVNTEGTQRYNARFNMDTRITSRFTIGTSLAFSRQQSNLDNITQDGGVLARATRLGPNFPAYDDQGRYGQREARIDAIELSTPNILAEIESLNRELTDVRFLGSIYGDWEIIDGLNVRGTFAANYQTDKNDFFNRRTVMYDWRSGEESLVWWPNRRLENQYDQSMNLTSWVQATYEKSFGANNFKALIGFNQESFDRETFGAARLEIPSNNLGVLNTGNPETSSNYGGAEQWALRSFFGRINYDYANKYLFEANVRRDGSSRFGPNNPYASFPSFSAGWVLSQEDFMDNVGFIEFLKIRASWGQLGNQNIGNYPFAAGISFTPAYNFGGTIVGGAAQTSLGNPDIRWETTTQTDIGINLTVLQGRLSVEADYFIRNTEDILFNQSNPGVTGVRTPTTLNIAEVRNTGWELATNYRDNFGGLNFSISANVTHVESEVVQIDPNALAEADRVIQGDYVLQRGQPINALYGLRAIGIFQSQSEIDGAPDQSAFGQPTPGDIRYDDVNGDGIVNVDDRVVLGKENPTWLYGINLNLSYRGFDLGALFQGVGDVDTYETQRFFYPFDNSGGVATFWLDRWTPENPSTTLPKLRIPGGVNHNIAHSWWMTPRDYLRLKNLQLGYTLPASLFRNNFVQSLRFYLNAQNLFTITDYVGFDPERQNRNTNAADGYPQLRIFTAGVNFKF